MKMTPYKAVQIAEGLEEAKDMDEFFGAWQYLIDTGIVYQLQGCFGRTAEAMIADGFCTRPETPPPTLDPT
jgi:hypothetical protein